MTYTHTDTDLLIEDQYPKLVRDKIPELIKSQGKSASTVTKQALTTAVNLGVVGMTAGTVIVKEGE